MNMSPNKLYMITKKLKIHTQPVREVIVTQTGIFVKETSVYFMFRGFRVRKACVIDIREVIGES